MADAKITALTEKTTPLLTDMMVLVDDPAGTPVTKKATKQNIAGGSIALSGNFTTASTTGVDITGLSFAIAANEIYTVEVYGTASKATSATGMKIAIACPASATIAGVQYGGGATLAAVEAPSLISAINTLGTTFATGTAIRVGFRLAFRVVNSSSAGTISIQAATVTSNTLTVYAGTYMIFRKSTNV